MIDASACLVVGVSEGCFDDITPDSDERASFRKCSSCITADVNWDELQLLEVAINLLNTILTYIIARDTKAFVIAAVDKIYNTEQTIWPVGFMTLTKTLNLF